MANKGMMALEAGVSRLNFGIARPVPACSRTRQPPNSNVNAGSWFNRLSVHPSLIESESHGQASRGESISVAVPKSSREHKTRLGLGRLCSQRVFGYPYRTTDWILLSLLRLGLCLSPGLGRRGRLRRRLGGVADGSSRWVAAGAHARIRKREREQNRTQGPI
jgi:hypothetical protein